MRAPEVFYWALRPAGPRLMGESLQHDDGHGHVLSSTVPCCVSYDPTFSYELAVIIQDGMRRMYVENEDIYYYITLLNENYAHPPMPEGVEQDILKGMYRLSAPAQPIEGKHIQLMGIRDHHRRQQRKHG